MKKNKISNIEVLRALACIGVFLCHFKGSFSPNSEIVAQMCRTPLNIMFSGNTFVRIMFVISGFVLSYKYISDDHGSMDVTKDVIKRYFRLMPALLVVDFLAWFLMEFGMMFNQETASLTGSADFLGLFNVFEPNLWLCLREGIFGNLFEGGNAYVGPLWTMKYEMYGSLLVLAVLSVLRKKRLRYLFYIVFICVFRGYYAYFAVGMLVCELYCDKDLNFLQKILKNRYLSSIILGISFSYVAMASDIDSGPYSYIIFAVIVSVMFLTLISLQWVAWLGDKAVFRRIGKWSFAIYLVHWPVIESFSCAYYLFMHGRIDNTLLILTDFALTSCMILFAAKVLDDYVITPGIIFSNRIANILIGRN